MRRPVPLADLTEKQWQRIVTDLATVQNFRWYHTWRSVKSPTGYPDLHLVRDRSVFLELKAQRGRLSASQAEWLRALHEAKQEAYVCRPSDLGPLAVVLAHRGDPRVADGPAYAAARGLREGTVLEVERVLGRAA